MDIKEQLKREVDAKTLSYCFSCGMCTGGCPVSRISDGRYNPRRILHRAVIEGKIEDDVWLCANCYTCQERCPTKTKVTDIITLMRRMHVTENGIPEFVKPLIRNLQECGFTAVIGDFENKRRARMELPPMVQNTEIRMIIAATGGGLPAEPEKQPEAVNGSTGTKDDGGAGDGR